MARKRRPRGWLWRIIAALVLMAGVAALWLWWDIQHWTPQEAAFPDQGAVVTSQTGPADFRTLSAIGADFVYLEASTGAGHRDSRFTANYAAAREAGLQVGAIHRFDPCVLADGQSANFATMVPREKALLPSAIALTRLADTCPKRVSDAAIESELMTLINQIEHHTGKPVILKITPEFEDHYAISAKLERNLWVQQTRFAPSYAVRPWLLWSANAHLQTAAAEEPLEWVVVQP
ncbi:GH25 family lysozyme [Pontixanthobacter sp.]|uniref:glycoside hydrolase family 25 protein n=1 Tax=Pontixanthobacter sp. TaxID=2792078 RepID=UPI003C79EE8B